MKALFIAVSAGLLGSALAGPVSAAEAPKSNEKVLWSFGGGGRVLLTPDGDRHK